MTYEKLNNLGVVVTANSLLRLIDLDSVKIYCLYPLKLAKIFPGHKYLNWEISRESPATQKAIYLAIAYAKDEISKLDFCTEIIYDPRFNLILREFFINYLRSRSSLDI